MKPIEPPVFFGAEGPGLSFLPAPFPALVRVCVHGRRMDDETLEMLLASADVRQLVEFLEACLERREKEK